MDPLSLTDELIDLLLTCPKTIKSKRPRETPKAKHLEKNLVVESDTGGHKFTLLTRQSTRIPESYSCGLLWHASPSSNVILARYNGSDHSHSNPLEGSEFSFACHIHKATERYIAAGRKSEHFALETTRYNTLAGAMACLMQDCNIIWPHSDVVFDDRQSDLEF
jgi:hypothetical protein